jgi:serine/threonine protein phosphatase PrpC
MTAAMPSRGIRAAGASDVGRLRDQNEDRFHVDVDRGTFIVIDGVGGHAAGETAAETALVTIRERLARRTGTVPDRIREAVTIANNEIHRLASTRQDWYGMACVLTLAVVENGHAVVGHVGDSRLYKLQGETIEKVTPDHSPVGEREDARELSEREAMRHPRRNEVYRDVGSQPHAVTDADFVFVTEIDFPPDAALLLCSDGLTDLVPSDTIRHLALSAAGSPADVVDGLINAANDAGGKDNITAVFVEGERFGAGAAGFAHRRQDRQERGWLVPSILSLAAIAALTLGLNLGAGAWPVVNDMTVLGRPAGAIVVRPGESISEAVARAAPGTTVVVEPGEYREHLTLASHVRVVSRVARAAILRLPASAIADGDAAVVATRILGAELAGFRIVGDAATPLGIGVLTRDASVRLVDLEIAGAAASAIDFGPGEVVELIGSEIHDNAGAAIVVRTGSTGRLSHNVFARNALSSQRPAAFVIERGSTATWIANVFHGHGPEALLGTDDAHRSSLLQDNWFVDRPAAAQPARGRGARGR